MVMKLRYLFLAVCLSTASLAQATSEAPSTKNKPLETASQVPTMSYFLMILKLN